MAFDIYIPSDAELDRREVEVGGLYAFGKLAWEQVYGRSLIETWHLKVLCEHLEAVTSGEIKRLIINVPPGTGKSSWACVMWEAWEWIMHPWCRWMATSYDNSLVLRDARDTRALIESDWYQERFGPGKPNFGPGCAIAKEKGKKSEAAGEYWTTEKGLRFSTSVGSKGVGWHAHRQIVDDPHKPLDANKIDAASFRDVDEWWDGTMSTRGVPGYPFARVIIMQRLSEQDLVERCLERAKEGKEQYHHLCFSMRFRASHPYRDEDDTRTEDGELLCPALKDEEKVQEEENDLGENKRAAQHDQIPSPLGGGVFKKDWFIRFWTVLPNNVEKNVGKARAHSWDHTFGSEGKTASWVVGQDWGRNGADYYLVDRIRDQIEFPAMKVQLQTFSAKHPMVVDKLIEGKAAGKPLRQEMKHDIDGMIEQKADASTGGKLARAESITGLCEAGNVWLPHPTKARLYGKPHPCPWVHEFIELICKFRGIKGDQADDVDAMSQALRYLRDKGGLPPWAQKIKEAREQRRNRNVKETT